MIGDDAATKFGRWARHLAMGFVWLAGADAARAGGEPVAPPPAPTELAAYVPDRAAAVLGVRPAALVRRLGSDRVAPLVAALVERVANPWLAEKLHVDPARPGRRVVMPADIEAILIGLEVKLEREAGEPGPGRINVLGTSLAVRAVAPRNWLGLLRDWGFATREVRGERATTYRLHFPPGAWFRVGFAAYQPDDRTLVVDGGGEGWVEALARRRAPAPPAWLRGDDWREAGRGLVAIALDNQAGRILDPLARGARREALDRDALILGSLLVGAERWVVSLADADELAIVAEATAQSPLAAGFLRLALGRAVDLARRDAPPVDRAAARAAVADEIPGVSAEEREAIRRVARADAWADLLVAGAAARLRIEACGLAVRVGSAGFGTCTEAGREVLSRVAGLVDLETAPPPPDGPGPPAARP